MIEPVTPFHSSIPSNKFYPPHIDERQSLFRSHLIEKVLPGSKQPNKIIAIEAQAGQGKTTLAYQYINHYNHHHIWYQVGKEDADPVVLLTGLLHSLKLSLTDFSSPQLENIMQQGEIGPLDLMRCANLLLGDVSKHLHNTLYIVFDDLHLISEAQLTNQLLSYLLDTSPPKLNFILTSRHPFELKSKTIRNRSAVIYLRTDDLALNRGEIEALFNDVFDRSISIADASKIEDLTSGWVMGIVLAAHPMSGRKAIAGSTFSNFHFQGSPSQKDMLEYFQDEILTFIPAELHIPFLKLSFVDEIHVDLARRITEIDDIDIILGELTQENLFIYNLDSDYTIFRFHHLFQEFLQIRAAKSLDKNEIRAIYRESAQFYLEHKQIGKALSCYLQGGEFAQMDALLKRYGVDIFAQNRTLTILTILHSIPEQTLLQHSWLTLFSGILESDFQPQKTLPHLEAAQQLFKQSAEEVGELLAIATILYYHFVVSGRYHTGASLLPRAEKLLDRNRDNLSQHITILVMRNLAAGFCFFSANMEKARYYIEQARRIAIDNSIRNFMASTLFIKAYIELLCGNRKKFRREVELSYSLINDPLVGMSNKLTLRVLHICNLSMHGDIVNFFHQQQLIRDTIDDKVVKQTVAAPYFFIWSASCYISLGHTAKALDTINNGVNVSATAKTEHMLSQLLQWQAYIHAIHGNTKSAEIKVAESTKLRKIAGGPFYESFNCILAGAVYAKLNKKRPAKDAFTRGLQLALSIPSPYLQACCLMQMSYFKLRLYGKKAALDDLEPALKIMAENDYDHFWGWYPDDMKEVLTLAVANKLQGTYATRLARKRLNIEIDSKGNVTPLLQVTVLDGFYLTIGGEANVPVDQLTPLQRDLLSLLLFSTKKKISQDKVQLLLWPDSSPEKSRKKLDTLLGRLRNTLDNNLPVDSRNYVVLNKGILSLKKTMSDVDLFFENYDAGFRHVARDEYWQAGNRFHQALTLWKGTLPTDTFRNDSVYSFEDVLLANYEQMALCWAEILYDAGRHTEAIPIVARMLESSNLSELGVVLLCRLYTAEKQPLKIREILLRYRKDLAHADYEEQEIASMIDAISERLG